MTKLMDEYVKLLKIKIKEVLENNDDYYCHKDENGMFYYEIYADYRDMLSDDSIKEIATSDCPIEKFDELMDDFYFDNELEVVDTILDKLDEDEETSKIIDLIGDDTIVRDTLYEVFYVNRPYEHYLKQELKIDIIVDTGDANYDYVLNNVYPHYNASITDTVDNLSSILWLTKQQGYKKSDLNKALRYMKYNDSKFLESVRVEVENTSSHMNALTFLVELTLEDYLKLKEKIDEEKELNQSYNPKERKGKGKITINKSATCGLYDCWNGAGGVLEIELEKEVVLPIKYIDTAMPDGCRGYGIESIYAPTNIWRNGKLI